MKKTSVIKHCEVCGKEYEVKKYKSETSRYCSKSCWGTRRVPFMKTCRTCKSQFDAIDRRAVFCSKECLLSWRTGDTSPVWKGGKASSSKRGMLKSELSKWRTSVFKRDNYTCQHCGSKKELNAHHIKPLAKFPDLALVLENGLTLCLPCHEKVHGKKISGYKKFPKKCTQCQAETKGRSFLCRSCSIQKSWLKRKGEGV